MHLSHEKLEIFPVSVAAIMIGKPMMLVLSKLGIHITADDRTLCFGTSLTIDDRVS